MTGRGASVFATSHLPLGNGAFTADGKLVVSHHPMYATERRVSIFVDDGVLDPYPNLAWNKPNADPLKFLDAVLGVRSDSQGRIWLADMGTRSKIQPKFVVWDSKADALWRVIAIPTEVTTPFSEPNDFVIDEARGMLYIADEGAGHGGDGSRAALIVLNLATGQAVRRLEGFPGIRAERGTLTIEGACVERNNPGGARVPLRVGLDGIVMDASGEWLYLAPLNGRAMWRLPIAALLNPSLDDDALAGCMERYADKPNSGGMSIDSEGNLYLTAIERSAIGRIRAVDRRYDEPVKRPDLFWPDGTMWGPDGALYIVSTQLPRSPALARPGERPRLPFKVFRWEPDSSDGGSREALPDRARALRGTMAGVIAAGAVTLFEAAWHKLGLPHAERGDPTPTEHLADCATKAAGAAKPRETVTMIEGQAIHLATGAGLGAGYALIAKRQPWVTAGGGAAYGLAVWATLAEAGLPLMRLSPSPARVPLAKHVLTAASHLVFGLTLHASARLFGAIDKPSAKP